jgi:hypothetical protein
MDYTLEQDDKIVELYKQGKTLREIAREMGVQSIEHVLTVLRGRPESGYKPYRRRSRRLTYFYDERFFDVIDTEAKAYYLGLFAANGWIKFNRGVTVTPSGVCFGLNANDRELLDTLHNLMGEQSPPVRLRKARPGQGNPSDTVRLVFTSVTMSRDLIAMGFGLDKTHTAGALSPYVPAELHNHYARG